MTLVHQKVVFYNIMTEKLNSLFFIVSELPKSQSEFIEVLKNQMVDLKYSKLTGLKRFLIDDKKEKEQIQAYVTYPRHLGQISIEILITNSRHSLYIFKIIGHRSFKHWNIFSKK